MSSPLEVVLIGAGSRGANAYAPYALEHPGEVRFVAVAEPDQIRRERFATAHGIPPERRFSSWEDLTARGQLGEGALVCTQDNMHVGPGVAALEAGYNVLLEKPMAPDITGCVQLAQTAERVGRSLQIGHVLRYTTFFGKLHEILEEGRLGDIITVEHRENVAYWHMAHSFVRGNWRSEALSSPMILAKCCHDLDILSWNMGKPCVRLSSIGSLIHFRPEAAGPEIPHRCVDNCPVERVCPFSAVGIYLEYRPFRHLAEQAGVPLPFDEAEPRTWPFTVLAPDPTYEARREAITNGPYGRCVYRSDNDVVDHQVVTMEFQGGASVVLVMHGHSREEHRSMRYDGTRATLRGRFGYGTEITIHDKITGKIENVPIETAKSGHGGGDYGLMSGFIRSLRGEQAPLTTARASLESHLMAFAAEEARTQHTVINMDEFRARAERLGSPVPAAS
jgi:predicted dehydrogenase